MKLFLIISVLLLSACNATTRLTGYVDPDYRENFQAHKILIRTEGLPLEEQKLVEEAFVETLSGYHVEAIKGLDVFPPTRKISHDKTLPIAKAKGADTVLLLYVGARDVQEDFVPPTYHPGTTQSYISGYGNYATVNTYTTSGYTSGGYTISKPLMAVFLTLFDVRNGKIIWEAEGTSGGSGFSDFSDLSVSAIKSGIEELYQDGLIIKRDVTETINSDEL